MKNWLHFILFFLLIQIAYSNDGIFYAKGNQLFPITETAVTVQKEILTLKKINDRFIAVTVYYVFFNPAEEKKLTVGFEAFSPQGDVDGTPKEGKHPFINDFTVQFNDEILTYNTAYVSDSLYTKTGALNSIDLDEFEGEKSGNYVDFYYVYHFDATFKKGANIVKHTYMYNISEAICYNYDFEYVLTAANRWANHQIDDFTLVLDIGEFETFNIKKSFFTTTTNWIINGIGKTTTRKDQPNSTVFHIQQGNLIFQQKNFKPKGDLFIFSTYCDEVSMSPNYLPYSYYAQSRIPAPDTDFKKRVLRNLPFARRGYVFKNAELSQFYKKLDWYIPNPNYTPNLNTLTAIEKEWVEKYR